MEARKIEQLKKQAGAAIDAQAATLVEISRYLHDHPELGWVEYLAVEKLTQQLREWGFAVETGTGGLETAFRATQESGRPGPTIAILAEYDALPDVGHGCGHNLIAAGALGAALGVQAVLNELGGAVVVLGTPAEEYRDQPEGKVKMLAAGAFAGIDVALMLHPSDASASCNTCLAFVAMEVVFHGRTAHAAADPWNGLNALDGVIQLFNGLSALRQHLRPEIRLHGVITDGGVVPNIIPERAAARFMVRAPYRTQVDELVERFTACAEGAALATGTRVELRPIGAAADVWPYPTLQELTRANFAALGEPLNAPIDSMGSTDFGDVSQVMPSESFYMTLGVGPIPWHSRQVTEASIQEPALRAMLVGAKVLAMDAIDLLAQPTLLERARREGPQPA